MDELNRLKEKPLQGLDMMDNDQLREERDRLLDENAKMRVSGPTSGTNGGEASTVRYLRSKVSQKVQMLMFNLVSFTFRYTTSRKLWSGWRRNGHS